MSIDVFISYSSKDKVVADAICSTLEINGARCWIAPRDVTPGKPYAECIVDGIAAAKVFVLVFSGNSNQSEQVSREVERAVCRGIAILPFRIEEVVPTKAMEYFLSTPHWLDALTDPFEQHLTHLATVVKSLLKDHKTPPKKPNTSRAKNEKIILPADVAPSGGASRKGALMGLFSLLALLTIGGSIAWLQSPKELAPPPPEPDPFLQGLEELRKIPFEKVSEENIKDVEFLVEKPAHERSFRQYQQDFDTHWITHTEEFYNELNKKYQQTQPLNTQALGSLTSLSEEIAKLRSRQFPPIEPSINEKLQQLLARIKLDREAVELEVTLDRVVSPSRDLSAYFQALQGVTQRYPGAAKSRRLQMSAEEMAVVSGVEEWNAFYRKPGFEDLSKISPTLASELQREGREIVKQYPINVFTHLPSGGMFKNRLFYGEEYLLRVGARDQLLEGLFGLPVGDSLYRNLYQINTSGQPINRYYLINDPTKINWPESGKKRIDIVIDAKRNTRSVRLDTGRNEITYKGAARHWTLLSDLEQRIRKSPKMKTSGWITGISLVLDRIETEENIDPILKVDWLEKVLAAGCMGSLAIAETCQEQLKQLQSVQYDPFVTWYDPDDQKARDAREQASRLLGILPSLATRVENAKRKQLQYQQPFVDRYRCVGWLKQDMGQGRWHAKDLIANCPDGSLYVVVPAQSKLTTLEHVGEISDQSIRWLGRSSDTLQEGRPLFLKETIRRD